MQVLLQLKLLEKKLSVRQTENFVKMFKNKKQKSNVKKMQILLLLNYLFQIKLV